MRASSALTYVNYGLPNELFEQDDARTNTSSKTIRSFVISGYGRQVAGCFAFTLVTLSPPQLDALDLVPLAQTIAGSPCWLSYLFFQACPNICRDTSGLVRGTQYYSVFDTIPDSLQSKLQGWKSLVNECDPLKVFHYLWSKQSLRGRGRPRKSPQGALEPVQGTAYKQPVQSTLQLRKRRSGMTGRDRK